MEGRGSAILAQLSKLDREGFYSIDPGIYSLADKGQKQPALLWLKKNKGSKALLYNAPYHAAIDCFGCNTN